MIMDSYFSAFLDLMFVPSSILRSDLCAVLYVLALLVSVSFGFVVLCVCMVPCYDLASRIRVYSCLMPSAPGIGSVTLTRF